MNDSIKSHFISIEEMSLNMNHGNKMENINNIYIERELFSKNRLSSFICLVCRCNVYVCSFPRIVCTFLKRYINMIQSR